jgi:hypothetical protein
MHQTQTRSGLGWLSPVRQLGTFSHRSWSILIITPSTIEGDKLVPSFL